MIKQAVIFCGGYGKRLFPVTKKIPKPMVNVHGKPFLYHLILQLKSNGIKNILLLCGYKSDIIKKYFNNGKSIGVSISYSNLDADTETLKRLINAKKKLNKEFLLLYCDNYCSLNLHELYNHYKKLKSKFLISVCKKNNGNILLNKNKSLVKRYLFIKHKTSKFVDIGYMILNKKILESLSILKNENFNKFIFHKSKNRRVNYYLNNNEYQSISDIKRLKKTRMYFKKKIILVDRDGVLNHKNKKHRYVRNLKELNINYKFIRTFKNYLKDKKVICITNQAGLSTGDINLNNLKKINNRIKNVCKKNKINIIDFIISPHHFNSNHFDRKPNPGLFLLAAKKYNFILDRTCYIGDDIRDIEAAYNAKTKCIFYGKYNLLNSMQKKKFRNIFL